MLSGARWVSLSVVVLTLGGGALSLGCAEGDSVGQAFENLGGSGGNSTIGNGGQGGVSTTTSTTTTTTTTTSDTTTTDTTTTDTTTTTTAPTCMDTGAEPNNSEATAKSLGTIDDCDGSGSTFSGVLNGPDDVDWFKYSGQDAFGCEVGPERSVTFMKPARVCKFLECESGSTPNPTCPGGTTGANSPAGYPGCCGTDGFAFDVDCSGIDDNATIYIRIDNPNDEDCIPYSVAYHY